MEDNLIYVVVAFVITGLVIVAYLWTLRRQEHGVRDEFDSLFSDLPRRQPEAPASSKSGRRARSTGSTGA